MSQDASYHMYTAIVHPNLINPNVINPNVIQKGAWLYFQGWAYFVRFAKKETNAIIKSIAVFQNHEAIVSKLRDLVLCNINSGLIKLAVGLVMTGRSRSLCLNSRLNESKTLKRVFSLPFLSFTQSSGRNQLLFIL